MRRLRTRAGFTDITQVMVFPRDTRVAFRSAPGLRPLCGYLVVPATLGPDTRTVVVLHGKERNADEYCDAWAGWACRHNRLVVCPLFDRCNWGGAGRYNLGAVFGNEADLRTPNPPEQWAFTRLLQLQHELAAGFGLQRQSFDLFGHSAGAQFAHRIALFCPQAPLASVLVANAGWFTTPENAVDFPYGLRHPALRFPADQVRAWTRRHLVLLRGARDTVRDPNLRTTPLADAQGANRYQRAGHMYRAGHAADPGCAWELVEVPGIEHDFVGMSIAAQDHLTR